VDEMDRSFSLRIKKTQIEVGSGKGEVLVEEVSSNKAFRVLEA
jgi:hypothetical protein